MSESSTNKTGFFGHPAGLSTLFFTEMWERFSYYGMRAILILFMTTDVAQEGLGLTSETAGAVYGMYTAGVYLLTLPGGWLADNIFGQRKAIYYGGILIMIGHLILAIPGSPPIFFAGLAFVAMGTGLLKPNISTIVGDLYPGKGAHRDAGFSLFYMGINLGSLLGQTIVAYLGEKINWHLGFGMAAIGMFAGLVQYRLTADRTLGNIGVQPKAKLKREEEGSTGESNSMLGIVFAALLIGLILVLQFTGVIDLTTAKGIAQAVGVIIVSVTLVYFAFILIAGGLNTDEKKRVVVIFFLFIGAALFWSGFEQAGSTLNLFAANNTNLNFLGWEMPAGWLQNVNPLFIIIFAPVIGALWIKLSARQMNPSTPLKFGLGLIMMGLGFLVMFYAAKIVADGTKANMLWLVLTYFLHSIGELTLSPVGLSATTKLAPRQYMGQMMGIWFVGASLGNLIAGLFSGEFDQNNVSAFPDLFMSVVMLGLGAGIIFIITSPLLKKWMGDVQ
ncbi:MAG: peptide MFS transporter [Saprospiraceae bacterium]